MGMKSKKKDQVRKGFAQVMKNNGKVKDNPLVTKTKPTVTVGAFGPGGNAITNKENFIEERIAKNKSKK